MLSSRINLLNTQYSGIIIPMPSVMEIITILVATISLFVAYMGFRDKRTDKTDKDLADRIKATVLADAATTKAVVLSDAANIKATEIKELQKQAYDTECKLGVADEKINSLVKITDQLSLKIDKISFSD